MLLIKKISHIVSQEIETTSDRYTQIWHIKQALISEGQEIFATDRETIDDVLDILFFEYKFNA